MVTTAVQASGISGHGSLMEGFLASWSMILVSEIGDKTFFIACLMAMRYPKAIVFAGAIGALAAMTVLSALMGVIVPSVLSVRVTQILAVILFFGFGCKILYDTLCGEEDDGEDERAEAAAAIGGGKDDEMEGGRAGPTSIKAPKIRAHQRFLNSFLNPIFVQAFTLTFVAEWGDRSQIATIALAAAKDPFGVTLGGVVGHSICTGAAVLFGNLISAHISHRNVNLTGGSLFIFFALLTLYQLMYPAPHTDTSAPVHA